MSISFAGKTAIVTGAAMGIGEACARQLSSLGAQVALLDRNEEAGTRLRDALVRNGHRAEFIRCDVSRPIDVEGAIAAAMKAFGAVDVLVSNAGIQRYGDVLHTDEQLWDEVMAINLKGLFLTSKAVLPHLMERGGGAIVAVGSVQSISALGNAAAYVTAKHALLGLVRSLALDFAARRVRVNCVLPGAIDTPMLRWAASLDADPEKVIDICNRMHPLGRIGTAQEVATAVAFLASDWASFITGASLLVDGGMLVPAGGMGFSEGGTGAAAKDK